METERWGQMDEMTSLKREKERRNWDRRWRRKRRGEKGVGQEEGVKWRNMTEGKEDKGGRKRGTDGSKEW